MANLICTYYFSDYGYTNICNDTSVIEKIYYDGAEIPVSNRFNVEYTGNTTFTFVLSSDSIPANMFQDTDIVVVEGDISSIGNYAFQGCFRLRQISLGNVRHIGDYAFQGTSITSVGLPSVETIGSYAFYDCDTVYLLIGENCTSIGEKAFMNSWVNDVVIKATIPPTIANDSFSGLEGTIYKPQGSDYSSWYDYVDLTFSNVLFNETLKITCVYVITEEEKLEEINILNGNYTNGDILDIKLNGVSLYKPSYYYFQDAGIYTFEFEFEDEYKLPELLFANIRNLTEVTIGEGFYKIPNRCFYICSVKKVNILGSTLSYLDDACFYQSGLVSIDIPDSVTRIGDNAFGRCSLLTSITCKATTAPELSTKYVFQDVATGGTLYYPSGSDYSTWLSTDEYYLGYYSWNGVEGDKPLENNLIVKYNVTSTTGTTKICNDTFGFSNILVDGISIGLETGYTFTSTGEHTVEFVLADETTIGSRAFYGCTSLTSVTIPDTVTSIGDNAFYGCSNLTGITIPDSVTTIGIGAFRNCSGLTGELVIPNSVTSIEQYAFYGCSSLTGELVIPDSVTSIGKLAFSNCESLTSLNIGSGITAIPQGAFRGCTSLTSVTIPDTITEVGVDGFSNCTGLTSVTIGNSVTTLSQGAFNMCTSLTSITIPKSVVNFGIRVFYNCSGLTSITVEATTAPVVESETFRLIATGGTLYYPKGSDYSTWLGTDVYYLGYYSWNGVEVDVDVASIELEYDSITFDSYAISTSIDVVYNEIETINEPLVYGSWINLTTMATVSQTNRYYFSLERNEGDNRQGTITFSGTDTDRNLITKILTITQTNYEEQMATSITIKKTSIEFPYEGSTDSVQVVFTNPNEILEPQPSQSFITVTESMRETAVDTSSASNTLITVHYDITMGETSIARNGTITFRCTDSAGNEITNSHLTCYQSAPSTASITFSPTSLTFPYSGGTSYFYARVTNPTEDGIGLETTSDYLVNFSSAYNYEDDDFVEYKVTVEADVNNTTTQLTEMLKVSYTDTNGDYLEAEYPIIIGYQGEGVCKAFVTKMDVYADGTPVYASNSGITVGYSGVTINTPVVNGDWITLGEGTVKTGVFYGYDTVMEYPVTFAANEGGARIGTITFSGVDGLNNEKSDVLTITQEAYEGGGEEEPDTPDVPEDSTDVYYGAIWQDVEYSFGGSENVTYTISTDVYKWFPNVGTYKEEEVIYKGVAWKSPDREGLSININKICQNYFDAQYLPLGTAVGISQNYKVFYLRGEMGELLRTYHFINDWSYEPMKMGLKTNPIIPHIVEGQYCFFSTLALGEMDVLWGMDYFNGQPSYRNVEMLEDEFTTNIIADSRREGISRFWFGSRYYDYVPKCKSHYVLYYSNPYGGWDWFPVMGKVTRTDSMTSYTYTQNYNNTKLDFGTAKYLNEIRVKYRLNTGWLKQSQSDRMWELLESNNVYLHNTETDEIYPVVITNTDVEFKRRTPTNKVINYDIDIELSQMRERL